MRPVVLPEVLRGKLEIWRLDLALDMPVPADDWAVLEPNEVQRAKRFFKLADCVRYVRTRAGLRRLLANRLGGKPQELRFAGNASGKPGLVAAGPVWAALEFNVSHAGEHALIAMSACGAVGVDIERCDPSLDLPALEALVLSPRERQMDDAVQPEFFERWVVKEAVLKAVGVGVGQHLQRLSVATASGGQGDAYRLSHEESAWPFLGAWRLDAPPGYRAAVACVLPSESRFSCGSAIGTGPLRSIVKEL